MIKRDHKIHFLVVVTGLALCNKAAPYKTTDQTEVTCFNCMKRLRYLR